MNADILYLEPASLLANTEQTITSGSAEFIKAFEYSGLKNTRVMDDSCTEMFFLPLVFYLQPQLMVGKCKI